MRQRCSWLRCTIAHFANVGFDALLPPPPPHSPAPSYTVCHIHSRHFHSFIVHDHDQEIVSVNQNYQLISLFTSDGFLNFVKLQFRRDRITTLSPSSSSSSKWIYGPNDRHKVTVHSVMATINGTAAVPFVFLCAKVICTRHTKHQLNRCTMTLHGREFLWRKRKSFQFSRWSLAI